LSEPNKSALRKKSSFRGSIIYTLWNSNETLWNSMKLYACVIVYISTVIPSRQSLVQAHQVNVFFPREAHSDCQRLKHFSIICLSCIILSLCTTSTQFPLYIIASSCDNLLLFQLRSMRMTMLVTLKPVGPFNNSEIESLYSTQQKIWRSPAMVIWLRALALWSTFLGASATCEEQDVRPAHKKYTKNCKHPKHSPLSLQTFSISGAKKTRVTRATLTSTNHVQYCSITINHHQSPCSLPLSTAPTSLVKPRQVSGSRTVPLE
jgi:hypothetical protein